MITGKIYFRKGKGAYINLSGKEIEEMKKNMKTGDEFLVRIEEDGTKIVLKSDKSIKI